MVESRLFSYGFHSGTNTNTNTPLITNKSTQCLKKRTVQIYFCKDFVKFPAILIIFGRKMAMRLKLCELHSFSTSPNSRHHTTVLHVDADVLNCYTTLKVLICNKLSNDLAHSKLKCCLLYTSPSPRDRTRSRMPSSA